MYFSAVLHAPIAATNNMVAGTPHIGEPPKRRLLQGSAGWQVPRKQKAQARVSSINCRCLGMGLGV